MKYFKLGILTSLIIAGFVINSANNQKQLNFMKSSVVTLYDVARNIRCSAAAVSDNIAITAAHCVVDGRVLYAKQNMEITDVKVVAINVGTDVAILKGDFKKFIKVNVTTDPSDALNALGSTGYACGLPHGGKVWCSKVTLNNNYLNAIKGEGLIYPGMSGGPVFHNGRVIAVNSAMGVNLILVAPLLNLCDQLYLPSNCLE
jgi:V8-like Glu-specific endopeptidase